MTAAAEKGPIHDVSARIRGPAVGHIQEVFNQHWNVADPAANLPVPPALPGPATPNAGGGEFGATLQIVRTLDSGTCTAFPDGEKGVLEAYLRAIAFAQRFIYIETQYLTDDMIIDALCDAVVAQTDLELILVLNISPDIPFHPPWQRAAVKKITAAIGAGATNPPMRSTRNRGSLRITYTPRWPSSITNGRPSDRPSWRRFANLFSGNAFTDRRDPQQRGELRGLGRSSAGSLGD
jgi:phosphatidylserine/phosphatidylglycerophosphate/cardiolipin synthase-like enzyme